MGKATTDTKQFIKDCEKEYQSIIDKIVKKIIEEDGREIIMLAGPSSAGKTTTAKRLKEGLSENGVTTYVLSLDDFYLNRDDIPYLPDGTQDYETVYALDLVRLENDLNSLLRGETVETPIFDFTTGKRSDTQFNTITLGQEDVVIIEGLHALNDELTSLIDDKYIIDGECIDADELIYKQIFPHYYIPETQDEQLAYVLMKVNGLGIRKKIYNRVEVYIYVVAHQGIMKVENGDGTRIDMMGEIVEELFNGNDNFTD